MSTYFDGDGNDIATLDSIAETVRYLMTVNQADADRCKDKAKTEPGYRQFAWEFQSRVSAYSVVLTMVECDLQERMTAFNNPYQPTN